MPPMLTYPKKIWLWLIPVLIVIVSVVVLSFVTDTEFQSWQALEINQKIAAALQKYRDQNGYYPNDLSAVEVSNQICDWWHGCWPVKYKAATNKQSYKLAILVNSVVVAYFDPQVITAQGINCCWGLAVNNPINLKFEKYRNIGRVYKLNDKIFSQPDDWPDFDN